MPSKPSGSTCMKYLCFALLVLGSTGVLRAQDEENRRPPTEIPDFSNLDDFVYEPKSAMTIGIRHLSPAKAAFGGGGTIFSTLDEPGPPTGANLLRHYHDGTLQPDARFAPRTDQSGNPVTDPLNGNQIFDPVAPDGRTNTWAYADPTQVLDNGFLVYHAYTAQVNDPMLRNKNSAPTYGLDLSVSREMGKLFGTRISWNLIAGLSVNDLSADLIDNVQADVKTDSDYYSLFGATPPPPPYASPNSKNVTLTDPSGKPILNDDGVPQTVQVDNSTLLANEPAARITTIVTDNTSVTNRWKLKGAYYTLRVGPVLIIPVPFLPRTNLTLSAGPALIYAGTNYTVTQDLDPATGTNITDTTTDAIYKLLPGYFADAALQFNVTDRTGFYAGAILQSAGSYTQGLNNATAQYTTKVDFNNLNGLRAGMTYRF
jgi:hypothetical protein